MVFTFWEDRGEPCVIADAAGIQEKSSAPPVHHRTVGMPEEEQIQFQFLGAESRPHQRLLDPVSVAVADQGALALDHDELFLCFKRPKVAVSGNLIKGNGGEAIMQLFCIPPTVPQMQDHVGSFLLHCLQHIGNISVGI